MSNELSHAQAGSKAADPLPRGKAAAKPSKRTIPNPDADDRGKKIKRTASGLEYFDVKEGNGEEPKSGQTCVVHYTGWLWENNAKGKKFDSSGDRGKPFEFPVGEGRVIKGWDEGVSTMKVGGKRELLIPAELGYGARGAAAAYPAECHLVLRDRVAERALAAGGMGPVQRSRSSRRGLLTTGHSSRRAL